jgi:electron-transferring-flavoprotein dehydrogenase
MAAVERERLETGVLFVGAGPATLSAAIRLVDLCRERGIDPPEMLVIEKASEIGEHQLSGAVMKPTAIAELIPEWKAKGFPTLRVHKHAVYFFTKRRAIRFRSRRRSSPTTATSSSR